MEKSKSNDQPRCPCGFWGSSSTLGLCSQCYKSHIEKTNDALQSTPDHLISPETARQMKQSGHSHMEGAKQNSHSISLEGGKNSSSSTLSDGQSQPSSSKQLTCESVKDSSVSNEAKDSEQSPENPAPKTESTPSSSSCSPAPEPPEKKGVKRDISQVDVESETPESSPEKGQKNRKRCYQCKCKLELAQRQIGRCKCDYVFCSLHRLPELHNCDFDHKEDGRREAREKMVKPTRHLGTSFQRLDPDS
ncbi:AN1-type zinc finger protein 3-like [Ostrea edulis]|uniref:AN1-type zinc finger protein 3-like n=1 Tax=Ostrea edulis TaxID=37623 RepID=UPI0024AF0C5B|nr:AN1-type zinc finger protein 3-like [Ostrea edulis]